MNSIHFIVRHATFEDLDDIMAVEAAWPEDQRAPREAFASRFENFAEGIFVSVADERIVGVTTSCPILYRPDQPGLLHNWDEVTSGGYLTPRSGQGEENALYIVSSGILPAYRRTGIREAHLHAQLDCAKQLALRYVVTGAMMPGYDRYCRDVGVISGEDYALLRRDGLPVDPTIRKLEAVGLRLPNVAHVMKDYYPSPESRDYGVLLVAEV